MRGSLTRRGAHSWRLKFDTERDPATDKRITKSSPFAAPASRLRLNSRVCSRRMAPERWSSRPR